MRASVDLPQPDSPTMPSTSPAGSAKRHAVDRAHHAFRRHHTAAHTEGPAHIARPRSAWVMQPRPASSRTAGGRDSGDPRRHCWRGTSRAQVSIGVGAAVAEGAAAKSGAMRGTVPGMLPSGCVAPRPCRAPGCSAAGRACRGALALANSASAGALSTTSPAYMTDTRSAMRATMPRSCVISSSARPSSRCSVCSSRRICACTVTSSAVVGSSAISSSRLAHQRHGDHHALAQAAGELVRDTGQPHARRGDADAAEQFGGAVECRGARRRRDGGRSTSAICEPIV